MTPEEKQKLIREQVAAKILWGSSRDEVAEWLIKQHAIFGEPAEEMLDSAERKRSRAIRDRAMIRLAFAAAGFIVVLAFLYIRFFSGVILSGAGAMVANIAMLAVALFSARCLLQNIPRAMSGEQDGPVD